MTTNTTGTIYFCPTVGDLEQQPGGGFDVCCDHPELHEAISGPALAAVRAHVTKDLVEEIAGAIESCVTDLDQWPGEFYQDAAAKAREVGSREET